MVAPRTISRSSEDEFIGWNTFIDMCACEELADLSPVQRTASLALHYMSEVDNGGHFQYFVNKAHFPHEEVVSSLRAIGALHSERVLSAVLMQMGGDMPEFPREAEEYIQAESEAGLSKFDRAWGEEGYREIISCLERYLSDHEREFLQWAP
jgi:hypothetical protein